MKSFPPMIPGGGRGLQSFWLSAANAWMGAASGLWLAALRRQQSQALGAVSRQQAALV